MTAVLVSLLAAYGAYLLYTALVAGWGGLHVAPGLGAQARRSRVGLLGLGTGLGPRALARVLAASGACALAGGLLGFIVLGGIATSAALGLGAAWLPVASLKARRRERMEAAREAWPYMIDQLRLEIGSLGRSVPQALFSVGHLAPAPLRPAFAAAEREWMISTDFPRSCHLLAGSLSDATADGVLETLVVGHETGGTGLDRRLATLAEDRHLELQDRKDALARQAGVRFARRFVLVAPAGMAVAGMSIGNGRSAYATPAGQLAVLVGVVIVAACWLWAGRLMRLPEARRVFVG
ncbi:MAG: type II secretion system F family protein [Acidimicrobiales bacterium]